MSEVSDSRFTERKWVVLRGVVSKLTMAVAGAVLVYLVHRAGLETLAMMVLVGGGVAALARLASDWRAGRKPWLPTERVVADAAQDDSALHRGSMVGAVLAKLTGAVLLGYLTVLLYDAGLTTTALAVGMGGGLAWLAGVAREWRDGKPPWVPTKRVQVTPEN